MTSTRVRGGPIINDVHHHWMPGEFYYNIQKYLRPGQEVVREGQRYPNLRFIVAHVGGAIFSLRYRLDPKHLPRFDRPDDGADFLSEGLDQIYVDTAPPYWTIAEVRFAIETLGADQVLFGSDYPANPRGQDDLGVARKIAECLPDASVRNKVLGENTARLFGVQ